ncbi:MAG: tannase/feruloyl esterase family alpha/beta hydrolase [Pseudomonadales bacterium]|nr:tannase/feruloyl esterase family alpha/beta hydrolase [Pseudomonadales bacterium]
MLSDLASLRGWAWSAVLCAASMQVLAAGDPEQACRDLYRLTDLSHAVEPGMFVAASEPLPDYCRVRGVINRAIRFEVTMPIEDWNGRLMFSAAAGMAGYLDDTVSLLPSGFAMATTDTGHSYSENETLEWLKQPEALLDYAYRANHLVTLFAKQIITTFYGRKVDYAYLKGCSNGGRAALMEALRFPEDYNGIIAGAPVFSYKEALPWMLAQARAQRANPLTHESLEVLGDASREACDLLDGVEDGVIDDPRKCTSEVFDISTLECQSNPEEGCLTPGQIETAKFMYAGLQNAEGKVLSHGAPPGAEGAGDWGAWVIDGQGDESANEYTRHLLTNLLFRNPQFDLDRFDPVADRQMLDEAAVFMDVWSADLTEFQAGGGKLLMYFGLNDFPLRAQLAIDYLALVEQQNGGRETTADFLRLFLVPGMLHCGGGPGPSQVDWVDPIVHWVEEGKAPDRIVGKQLGLEGLSGELGAGDAPVFTRPICRYPKYAKYSGRGDIDDEQNFRCVSEQLDEIRQSAEANK